MILNVSDSTPSTGKTVEDRANVGAKILNTMENMFFYNIISVIVTLFGLKLEDLDKRPATKWEKQMFLEAYEMYDDSGEPRPETDIYTYDSRDALGFVAIGDKFDTLVLEGSRVFKTPSKPLTKAWNPLVNEWDVKMSAEAVAKAFGFETALVPEERLKALREDISKDPVEALAFGCLNGPSYDIFKEEDYDTLMSPNGDIMIVFDDYVIIMS